MQIHKTHTHTCTTVFWLSGLCLGLPGELVPEETPIVVVSHPLFAYDPW